MKNKKFLFAIPVFALVLGITACGIFGDDDDDGDNAAAASIEGTWVDDKDMAYKFTNGSYELLDDEGDTLEKGTYTVSDNKITITKEQIREGKILYTKAEALAAFPDEKADVEKAFAQQKGTFTVNKDTLTIKWESGKTITLTKGNVGSGSKDKDGDGDKDGDKESPSVVGTWKNDKDAILTFKNDGTYERFYYDEDEPEEEPVKDQEGTYTTDKGSITMTVTKIKTSGTWYTKAQLLEANLEANPSKAAEIEKAFAPQTGTYTITGNKLKITYPNGSFREYTKQ